MSKQFSGTGTVNGYCVLGVCQDTLIFSGLLLVIAISLVWQSKEYTRILWRLENCSIHEKTALLTSKTYSSHGSIPVKTDQGTIPTYRTGIPFNVSCHTILAIPMLWLLWIASINYIFTS